MKNKDRMIEIAKLDSLKILPVNQNILQMNRAPLKGKKKYGYIKIAITDEMAEEFLNGIGETDKGVIAFMLVVDKKDYKEMYLNEAKKRQEEVE